MAEIDSNKLMIYNSRKLDSTTMWLLFLFLGWSYGSMGQMGLQIIYYLTAGGCGVWTLVRLFTLNKAIKEYNKQVAMEVGLSADEIMRLGLS